ncbi:MAG: Na/Pi cotransporter family protein [Flavobacteriales bacterium]|nr:Na/Pi cotransporter family protein [Flavobacteriales bacterium]
MESSFGIFETLRLIGSLGLFIYGMKMMSDGIQKVAGNQMRQVLGAMTSNRFTGLFTGFFTTALIQSSSATTVMIVSFVNAGLLTLRQAIGVIMGANIGTTMTAVLILVFGFSKFSIADYALPLIAFGFPMLFFKNNQIKSAGETIIGFSVLFMGLDFLKSSVPVISGSQLEYLIGLTEYGIFSTLLFVGIGTALTIIVQSSSAAMALTIIMCERGMPLEMAAAIVLGENIGTTITANLAALIANVHAKRAARAHLIFNLIGVTWMLFVFPFFLHGIEVQMEDTPIGVPSPENSQATKWALTFFHLSFNIVNTSLLIWFVSPIASLVTKLVPSKSDEDEQFSLEYIGGGIMSTPELSLVEAQKELVKFSRVAHRMLGFLKELLFEKDRKEQTIKLERLEKYEKITDKIEIEIADYLMTVSQGDLSEESSKAIRSMLDIVSEMEQMGDIFFQMSLTFDRKINSKAWFTLEQRRNLLEMFDLIDLTFENMIYNLENNYADIDLGKAESLEQQVNQLRDRIRKEHLDNMGKGDYNIDSGMIYNDLYSSLERAGDLIFQINEAIAGKV